MSCDWAQKLMVLADGLTKEEQVELERHLKECTACAREWQKWQRLHDLLMHLPSLSSTPEERSRLLVQLSHVQPVPDLDCSTALSYIWRWVDNDLSEMERASFVVHLANCDKCQSALWQAEQTVQMLRLLPRLKATSREKEALKAKLRSMHRKPTVVPFVWRVALPIAAAAVFLLAIVSRWQLSTPDRAIEVRPVQPESLTAKTEPTTPKPTVPQVAEQVAKPQPTIPQRRHMVSSERTEKPKLAKAVTTEHSKPVQTAYVRKETTAKQLMLPEPTTSVQPSPAPVPEPIAHETIVAEVPKSVAAPNLVLPVPSQVSAPPIVSEPSEQEITSQQVQEKPVAASPVSEPRKLIALPPITIEGDLSLQPPRVQLTVVPPSQRLYQKSGVALVTVLPEKRPVKVTEEKALSPDLSIPLAAEKYRSHTASIPFFRFGVSW